MKENHNECLEKLINETEEATNCLHQDVFNILKIIIEELKSIKAKLS